MVGVCPGEEKALCVEKSHTPGPFKKNETPLSPHLTCGTAQAVLPDQPAPVSTGKTNSWAQGSWSQTPLCRFLPALSPNLTPHLPRPTAAIANIFP